MTGEWPIDRLDVAELTAKGWTPHPFRQVVLKLHSRCDLACDYCFIYRMGDTTWQSRPPVITPAVIDSTARRIAEHCQAHQLADFTVILHGGEPLLAGPDVISDVATSLRANCPTGTRLDLRIQTNGRRLDRAMLDLLARLDIKAGVSLDGTEQQHDKHRRTHSGAGSYAPAAQALRLLQDEYRQIYAGLLCVIDLDTDPAGTYEALLEFAPPAVDFLLPHGNWSMPPPRRPEGHPESPYGDWLVAVFDRWYTASSPQETVVRTFQEIITLALGGASRTESIGLSPVTVLVVDTDGSLEQVDALRSVHHGAAGTGMSVFDQDFDELLTHPAIVARQIGIGALAQGCLRCHIHVICGAGYYPHRYRRGAGFRNPSVYCPDLTRLIDHIVGRVRADIAKLVERTP